MEQLKLKGQEINSLETEIIKQVQNTELVLEDTRTISSETFKLVQKVPDVQGFSKGITEILKAVSL